MTAPATFDYTLGMGGYVFDPGGANIICNAARAKGFRVPSPFQQSRIELVRNDIKSRPLTEQIFYAGDSCGANKGAWVATAVYPRKITGMYLIQPSFWCNAGEPAIPDNVEEVIVWYGSWAMTGGLGVYKPPLKVPPKLLPGEDLYDGKWRTGNNGKTRIRYIYRNWFHPDDNDPYIDSMIIERLVALRASNEPKAA